MIGRERRGQDRQREPLPPVESLGERHDSPSPEQNQRRPVGRVGALLERAREQEQPDAQYAAEQVRHLEQREGQQILEPFQASGRRGRRAREQEEHPSGERREHEEARHQRGDPLREQAAHARDPLAALRELVPEEEAHGEEHREEVVDDAVS